MLWSSFCGGRYPSQVLHCCHSGAILCRDRCGKPAQKLAQKVMGQSQHGIAFPGTAKNGIVSFWPPGFTSLSPIISSHRLFRKERGGRHRERERETHTHTHTHTQGETEMQRKRVTGTEGGREGRDTHTESQRG